MKQSERLLVYLVTGFLAVILVIAVVFGREPARDPSKKTAENGTKSLDEMFVADAPKGARADVSGAGGGAGGGAGDNKGSVLPTPSQVTPQPPLIAAPAVAAADQVALQLGPSRRDRTVRFVHAKAGDSLEILVRRWCGSREYLAEAKSLNEELSVIQVGQEIGVPWVDDAELLAAIEAQKPKVLVAEGGAGTSGVANGGATTGAGNPVDGVLAGPDFKQPGTSPANTVKNPAAAKGLGDVDNTMGSATTAAGTSYVVKSGDSLWRIAERTYGRKNADRMVPAIKAANPGVDESHLQVDKKLVLPPLAAK